MSKKKGKSIIVGLICIVVVSIGYILCTIIDHNSDEENKVFFINFIKNSKNAKIATFAHTIVKDLSIDERLTLSKILSNSNFPPPYKKPDTYDIQYELLFESDTEVVSVNIYKYIDAKKAIVFFSTENYDKKITLNVVDDSDFFVSLETKYLTKK